MSAPNIRNELGPYKATKLWNDIIRIFRSGMPIGRHWKQLRPYDDCFVASEAVDWLFDVLQHRHDSGPTLTRPHILKLLQKFHRSNYITDVRGSKYNAEPFEENNRLFRFVALSPIKTPQWPRVKPAMSRNHGCVAKPKDLDAIKTGNIFGALEPSPENAKVTSGENQENHNILGAHAAKPEEKVVRSFNGDSLWKTIVLQRLWDTLLVVDDSQYSQYTAPLLYQHVKHNMTILHKNGYVTGFNRSELPPAWVISAMRYLAKWPDKGSDTFPEYEGFEKDVFVMIKEYFESLEEPLITFGLYPMLIRMYISITACQPSPIETRITRVLHVSETTPRKHSSAQSHRYSNSHRHSEHDLNTRSEVAATRPLRHSYETQGHYRADAAPQGNTGGMMVVYDDQQTNSYLPPHHHSEPEQPAQRWSSAHLNGSCRDAVDIRAKSVSTNYVNVCGTRTRYPGEYENGMGLMDRQTRLQQPQQAASMARSVSMSRLLAGPRMETAFVGEEAYTVYHPSARSNQRTTNQRTAYIPRAQSVYNLDTRQPTTAQHSYNSSTHRSPHNTRAVSERCVPEHKSHDQLRSAASTSGSKNQLSFHYTSSANHSGSVNSYYQNSYHQPLRSDHCSHGTDQQSYRDAGSIRLKFHSSPYTSEENSLPYGLFDEEHERRLIRSLQLTLLFLPPANRRVLHMLLRLLHKLSVNERLSLDEVKSNKHLAISSFRSCIIKANCDMDSDIVVSSKLVEVLVENYEEILAVPTNLRFEIERQIAKEREAVMPKPTRPLVLRNQTNVLREKKGKSSELMTLPPKVVDRLGITPNKVFCKQVTTEEYRSQANQLFDSSMRDLLESIVHDAKMSVKDKTKRLKQFERMYPKIFAERFPNQESVKKAIEDAGKKQPKIKPALIAYPKNLLRKLR